MTAQRILANWGLPILLLFFSIGCRQAGTAGKSNSTAPEESIFDTSAGELSDPFEGVIEAQQWANSSLNTVDVTYTITRDAIRREAVVRHKIITGEWKEYYRVGVICFPAEDKVLLYRARHRKSRYVRMTLAEYRDHCQSVTFQNDLARHGYGIIFVGLPESGDYLAENTPDAVQVDSLPCDELIINHGRGIVLVIESDHCREIKVDRSLLELVEVDPPKELTGFPLRVRRANVVEKRGRKTTAPKGKAEKLLDDAVTKLSKGVEAVTEHRMEVTRVSTTPPKLSDFDLPLESLEVSSLSEIDAAFAPKSSGGGLDFD